MVEHEPNSWHDRGGLLADLLCKIKSDTSIGHYVKKLDLSMWNNGTRDGWKPNEVFNRSATTNRTRLRKDSKTNMDIVEEAIRAIEIIPAGPQRKSMTGSIKFVLAMKTHSLRSGSYMRPHSTRCYSWRPTIVGSHHISSKRSSASQGKVLPSSHIHRTSKM